MSTAPCMPCPRPRGARKVSGTSAGDTPATGTMSWRARSASPTGVPRPWKSAHPAMRQRQAAAPEAEQLTACGGKDPSQDEARQVLVLEDLLEPLADVCSVDQYLPATHLGRVERDLVEQALHHRVEAPCTDVLGPLVHLGRDARDLGDGVVAEDELHALGVEERRVLTGERVLGLREDADEVVLGERLELHADREAALELGDQVRGLGDVGRA